MNIFLFRPCKNVIKNPFKICLVVYLGKCYLGIGNLRYLGMPLGEYLKQSLCALPLVKGNFVIYKNEDLCIISFLISFALVLLS